MIAGLNKTTIRVKRIYEPRSRSDGVRVLIDRLWPRGIKKQDVHIDQWQKELAPSSRLRKWFGHRPERWDEFRRRYAVELGLQAAKLRDLRGLARNRRLTLLFSAHDEEHNDAVALQDVLIRGRRTGGPTRGSRRRGLPRKLVRQAVRGTRRVRRR
jgi:uncharacterized protein YeaO (DUF488 family)